MLEITAIYIDVNGKETEVYQRIKLDNWQFVDSMAILFKIKDTFILRNMSVNIHFHYKNKIHENLGNFGIEHYHTFDRYYWTYQFQEIKESCDRILIENGIR